MNKLLYTLGIACIFLANCSKEEDTIQEINENSIQQEVVNKEIIENTTLKRATNSEIISYSKGVVNKGYKSSIVHYPKMTNSQKLPVLIVMHGWMGSKEKMGWIGELLATKGFASIVISAANNRNIFANPKDWIKNYEVAFASIKGENKRKDSPLFNRLDLSKISIIGHSMGAGGALYYADLQKIGEVKSIIAMAPYSLEQKPGKNNTSPTLIIAGGRDLLALPIMTKDFYKSIKSGTKKNYIIYQEVSHNDFQRGGNHHDSISLNITQWLDRYGR